MGNTKHSSTSRLLAAAREAQDQTLRLDDGNEHARARARLLQAVDIADRSSVARGEFGAASGARSPGWRLGIGTLAAATCAIALTFAFVGDQDNGRDGLGSHAVNQPLEFEVDGVAVATNDTNKVIIAAQYSRAIAFSDGTAIELSPGGRLHFDDIRSNGASVVLDAGVVALAVHHEHDTSWQVAAGPWQVHVTGTQFSVAWAPDLQSIQVSVTEGSVRVEGPDGDVTNLRGGDTLIRERGKATIEPETLLAGPINPIDGAADSADSADADLDGLPLEPASTELDPASKSKPAPAKQLSWDQHFDKSQYDAAWKSLSELPGGIHGEAKHASADTLLDLADVAHYTKHADDARKLLEQLRERFPASDAASKATFALGRLAATSGSQAKAATWFELYLDELPNGSLAGDALARLIDSYDALGRNADAAATAKRYLARYPKGPHADKAAKILAR